MTRTLVGPAWLGRWYVRWPAMLVLFAALCLSSAYAVNRMLATRLFIEVPTLEGRSLDEARQILADMGLEPVVTAEVYDRDVPAGHVISQSVEPGTAVRSVEVRVEVTVSRGSEVRLIPLLVGQSVRDARRTIEGSGLVLGPVIEVHSATVPRGEIIAQLPEPDKYAGEPISLVASMGPHEVTYYSPLFVGKPKMDALMLAAELGLSVKVHEFAGSEVVTMQDPPPGAELVQGGQIVLQLGGTPSE